jgi:dolichol-phosphate mannosyltransferase
MKENNFISAVIYACNAENTIKGFIESVELLLSQRFEHYELIIVNDASSDGTESAVKAADYIGAGHLMLISLPFKHGMESAMLAGLDRSVGDFVFEFDYASLNFQKEKIMEAYDEALKLGADIVGVSPRRKHNYTLRSLFYSFANMTSQHEISLHHESFRLVSRRVLNAMLSSKEIVRYRKVLYSLSGYKYMRLFYDEVAAPVSSRPMKEDFSLALDYLCSYTAFIPGLSRFISFIFFTISIIIGGYAIFQAMFNRQQISAGWASIISFISIGFSGVFMVAGLLIEYMYRILIESQQRKKYSYTVVENLKKRE